MVIFSKMCDWLRPLRLCSMAAFVVTPTLAQAQAQNGRVYAPKSTISDGKTDLRLVRQFGQAILSGDDKALSRLVDSGIEVSVALRNPISHSMTGMFSGSGIRNLLAQKDQLLAEVGQPKRVSCQDQQVFAGCKFDYVTPDRALILTANTRAGRVVKVTFLYLTPKELKTMTGRK